MKIQISTSASSSSGADKAYENFKVQVKKYLQQTSLAKFSKVTSDRQVFPSVLRFLAISRWASETWLTWLNQWMLKVKTSELCVRLKLCSWKWNTKRANCPM